MGWGGEKGSHQKIVRHLTHLFRFPLPMNRNSQQPILSKKAPGHITREGTLSQVYPGKVQGESHIQSIIHKEKGSGIPGRHQQIPGETIEEAPFRPGSPKMEGHPPATG